MTDNFGQFLSHFKVTSRHDNKIKAVCPAHEDKEASLSITLHGDNILAHCFGGCDINDVLSRVGLTLRDLFLNEHRQPEDLYQYRHLDSSLNYEKEKYRNPDGSKNFKYRRLTSDGQIVYNLDGIVREPFGYPELKKAIADGQCVLYCEGEKDTKNARLLGYTATTMGGADDWRMDTKTFSTTPP